MKNKFYNKKILVTGGTGSIGSAIVHELLNYNPGQIRIYSRDETRQFELSHNIPKNAPVNFLIGDIRDKERLNMAMENVDIVFNVAAMKHVSACEKNPFEAVKTNVQGTQNIIDCAFNNNVTRVIGISTDKATDPSNVMGCTKLLAEKIMLASFFYKGNNKTKFCFVRFGNVLGSRGSVLPLFIKQLKQGKPLTVTNPKMTRFFMSIHQAVGLVFQAASLMQDREIFVLKMPVASLKNLAQATIEAFTEINNVDKKYGIKIIGQKPGEKIHEKLLTIEESENALETDNSFIILPNINFNMDEYKGFKHKIYAGAKKARIGDYTSDKQKKMSVVDIKKMLVSNGDLNFKL